VNKKHIKYICIAILIKLLFFTEIVLIDASTIGIYKADNKFHLYNLVNGDDVTYIEFCENIFKINSYAVQVGSSLDYTFRMPGLAFIYVPVRFFCSQELTLNLIVFFQIIFSAVTMYLLALLAEDIFKSKRVFFIVFITASLDFYMPSYNRLLMTESLGISSMIASVYFFNKFFKFNQRADYLLLSGIFITWTIFLRPYMLVFYFMLCLLIVIHKNGSFIINLRNIILFTIPFIISDGIWIYRNYKITTCFIPLQTSNNWADSTSKSYKQALEFIKDFGFHWEQWVRDSESGWLFSDGTIKDRHSIFKDRTFNGDLTIDSLITARRDVAISMNKSIIEQERVKADNNAYRIFLKFSEALKNQRPLDYYLINRVRLIKNFYVEQLYYPMFKLKFPINACLLVAHSFIDNLIKIIGWIGIVYVIKSRRKSLYLFTLIAFVPLFITLLFPIYIRSDESRFLVLAYPFLIIASSAFIDKLIVYSKRYNYFWLITILLIPLLLSFYNVGIKIYHGY
jgi:hypothetical protein